jgi:hypothetical protein
MLLLSVVSALPAPTFENTLQIPLATDSSFSSSQLGDFQHKLVGTESPITFIGITFESASSLDLPSQYFELPLGARISVGK